MSVSLLLAAAVVASPAQLFLTSDVAQRLKALNTEVLQTLDLGGGEVLAVEYIPKQGALSEWDDESRLVLYKQDGMSFTRVQFVSKAGQSIPGRIAGLEAVDLDHDGTPELIAIGYPHAPSGKVTSQIYRRPAPGARYEQIWKHKDLGACFRTDFKDAPFTYITLDPQTFAVKREGYTLKAGELTRTP